MVFLLFFLSGMAGLIYEISWSRQLGLYFGHSVYAAAVVLAAYFAGMALGYFAAGRLGDRVGRPLAAYGWAELLVAGWALATPYVLHAFTREPLADMLNHSDPGLQLALRAGVTFLALLPATIAMGATLPFIARHVSPAANPSPARIVRAYAFNTAGAMTGVLLATGLLILLLGVNTSSVLAAGISAFCGIAALLLAGRSTATAGQQDTQATAQGSSADEQPLAISWYVLAALSGAGVLALQVLFVRMFALTFHNSTYTFGAIVAAFLCALALGGFAVARYSKRLPAQPWAALACIAGGLLTGAGVFGFQRFTSLGYFTASGGFTGYILSAVALVAFVVVPGIAVLATLLPYCWTQLRGRLERGVGNLTSLNTISATAGVLLTSFALLPAIGLWKSFAVVIGAYVLCGILLLLSQGGADQRLKAAGIGLGALAVIAAGLIQWPIAVVPKSMELKYAKETPYGIISVLHRPDSGDTWLRQNNHYTLGATSGSSSEIRQGNIPLLLHPNPREVCFLGLATGITAGASLMHPVVADVVAIELIPEVIDAARFFGDTNLGIVDDDKATIIANDARHYLYATDRDFDVIISDLFVPWHSQTGYLYTVEHYTVARKRLKPGGLFCQWLPMYQLSEDEFRIIADSFASVFPCTSLWRGEMESGSPVMALVGTEEPIVVDMGVTERRLNGISRNFYVDTELWSTRSYRALYAGDWQVVNGEYLNTDEHPRIEFLAPISHRDREALTGDNFDNFTADVLDRLPRENVRFY